MKKQRSLVFRLSLLTISVFIVLFTIFNVISNQYISYISKKDNQEIIEVLSKNSAILVQEKFSKTFSSLQADRDMIVASIAENSFTGSSYLQYKNEALQSNEDILGYSIILDSSHLASVNEEDLAYIGDDLMYAPYINRANGSINTIFVEDAVNEEFYTDPKENGQPYITEPYEYEIDGKKVSMVSVTVPITIENKFIGVVIADFSLDFLSKIVQTNLPETAIQRVITAQGTIISDSASEANISTSITQFTTDWDAIKETVQKGETWSFYAFAKTFDAKAYSIFLPIELGDSSQKWVIQTFLPNSTLLATFYTILKMSLSAGILIAIILAASIYFFIYRHLKPLQNVQIALQKAAQGELTVTVDEKRLNNDEIGAVGMAYNSMRNEMHTVVSEVRASSVQVDTQADTMNRVIEEMSQSSDEISKAIDEIAKGTLSQAEEIEQSNVQMSLLGEQIDDVSLLSSDMLMQIKKSGEQAVTGMQEVVKLRKQSENTNEVNNQLEQQMKNLSQKIANIDQVMHSIQGITAQTNLLALNASIEAARAGEHGKGFAVVAEEVRKLAEQSHKETETVQHTVTSILQEAEQTALIVQKNSMLLTLQNDAVTTTEDAFSEQLERAETIQQQLVGLIEKLTAMVEQKEAVMTGMQTVAAISEQSAASAEEVTASADEQQNEMKTIVSMMNELKDVASQLNAATTRFKL